MEMGGGSRVVAQIVKDAPKRSGWNNRGQFIADVSQDRPALAEQLARLQQLSLAFCLTASNKNCNCETPCLARLTQEDYALIKVLLCSRRVVTDPALPKKHRRPAKARFACFPKFQSDGCAFLEQWPSCH